MKCLLSALMVVFVLSGCQKKVSETEVLNVETIASEVLLPQPCHSTSFITDYPDIPGEVPKFRFTKTLWPDTRVKNINMLSRANPIHPAFKPQSWELIGKFTYTTNTAFFNGTKELWEYYKTPSGAAGKKSILKKNVSLQFSFYNKEQGTEQANDAGTCYAVHNLITDKNALRTYLFPFITVGDGSDDPVLDFSVDYSAGRQLVFKTENATEPKFEKKLTFYYNPGAYVEKRNLSYQPTQNWISLEYSLLEVMQWLPSLYRPSVERGSLAVEFYPYNTLQKVIQSQVYKNHQYDDKGNMLSFTYGDNIAQRTTWDCSN